MTILDTIVQSKRLQFSPEVSYASQETIDADKALEGNPFVRSLFKPGVSIIGEIKPSSPSAGKLLDQERLPEILSTYRRHCTAISVLTDEKFFGGSFDLLTQVKQATDLPVLCKDFIVSTEQILLAKKHGADAILLIAKILKTDELNALIHFALSTELCPVVEINNLADLEAIKNLPVRVVLINNRNLDTMQIDLDTTNRLASLLKEDQIIISASGIKTKDDICKLNPSARRFLVGTSLMLSRDPATLLSELIGNPDSETVPKIKICGITNGADARLAVDAGADFIGLIFAPSSKRQVSLAEAGIIVDAVENRAKTVGVFQNQSIDEVNHIAKDLNLDFVQLHGQEDSAYANACVKPVIKVFQYPLSNPASQQCLLDFSGATYFLFDLEKSSTPYETAELFSDLNTFLAPIRNKIPSFFLAGKLSPDNVQKASQAVRPFALDVASGVEISPGIKSTTLTKQFCESAKSNSNTHAPQVVNK